MKFFTIFLNTILNPDLMIDYIHRDILSSGIVASFPDSDAGL